MNNNLDNNIPINTLTPVATLTPAAKLTKMDPLNQQALEVMLTQGTNKHMFTHETTGQSLTYLEMRERYG